jgi:hypothetical protein
MRATEFLIEDTNTALLSWSAKVWYVHFFKDIAHGRAIINSGIINPGSDDIVWAIKQGRGYSISQIETDHDTGEQVPRAGAIIFAPFDAPDVENLRNLSAWRESVECATAYLVTVNVGKLICNDATADKIPFISMHEYKDQE